MSITSAPPGQTAPIEKTPPPPPVTFEEFMEWMDEDTNAEWVEGEIIMTSPARVDHQDIRDFLLKVMGLYADTNQVGKIISSPFVMRLPTRPSGREPDLIFIRTEHFKWLRETHLDGPANLVVEIVSPESDARDRGDKFVEYESAGIPEYWLIDPLRQQAVFYELTDGRYRPGTINEHGIYHSQALPGFWLRIEWLWIAAQATARRADYTQAMQEALRLALGHNRLRELLEE